MYRSISVQQADFSSAEELDNLRNRARGGAVCLFSGIVREHFQDNAVTGLILEHYPGMTEKSIDSIVDQAAERWELSGIRVVHRVGQLAPGEQIVLVCCVSEHRREAFAACQFVMDLLKTDAVFWKKEHTASSERWIESSSQDHSAAGRWRTADDVKSDVS